VELRIYFLTDSCSTNLIHSTEPSLSDKQTTQLSDTLTEAYVIQRRFFSYRYYKASDET